MRLVIALAIVPALACGGEGGSPDPRAALSAYFGLDDALPAAANLLCAGAAGMDGMPVVFDAEIDQTSLDAEDFSVVLASGEARTPACATRSPAVEESEDRTVLLLGDLGDAATDPPVELAIVGSLLAEDGAGDFRGARVGVTPLSAGPSLVWAERAEPAGSGCPDTAGSVLRVVWQGGVRALTGEEVGAPELARFHVEGADGAVASPIAFGDLGDQDNNLELCLAGPGPHVAVSVDADTVIDPGGDANPATTASVTE